MGTNYLNTSHILHRLDTECSLNELLKRTFLQCINVTHWRALSVCVSGIREYLCNLSNGTNAPSIPCLVLLFVFNVFEYFCKAIKNLVQDRIDISLYYYIILFSKNFQRGGIGGIGGGIGIQKIMF